MSDRKASFLGRRCAGPVRSFPAESRREAGHQLFRVQIGLDPGDWKPMKSIGPGVVEIRVHEGGEYRVVYLAKFAEAVYVLHAFEKRTRQTRKADIDLTRRSFAEVNRYRSR